MFPRLTIRFFKRRYPSIAVIALLAAISTGCQQLDLEPMAPSPAVGRGGEQAVIHAGDQLRISFPGAPELDQAVVVRMDGKVSLALVGDVQVAGKPLDTVQTQLTEAYTPHLREQKVLVGLEAVPKAVYVSGAVANPGRIPLDRPMTVLEAIMEAGGFTEFASPARVRLIRQENWRHETRTLDLRPALNEATSEAVYLRPYDVVMVGTSTF